MAGEEGRLSGLVAIVTGGGSGIGRAVVARFIAEGARVVAVDRDDREMVVGEYDDHNLSFVAGDVRDPAVHQTAVDLALSNYGRLDVYIANAGVYDYGQNLEGLSMEALTDAYREIFDVNVLGVLHGARASAPALRNSQGSMIFTISSSGTYAGGGGALYVGSKHAVVGLVKQLANEFAPDVRVNGVAPGVTRTGLTGVSHLNSHNRHLYDDPELLNRIARAIPLGFVSQPEDHAGLYVTLADVRDSRFMTGVVIASDGGLAAGPRRRSGPAKKGNT